GALGERGHDRRYPLPADRGRGAEAEEAPPLGREARPENERLVAAGAGVLAVPDRVGRHLSREIDGERAVDAREPRQLPEDPAVVHVAHRKDAYHRIAIEPAVEPFAAERERRDGVARVE